MRIAKLYTMLIFFILLFNNCTICDYNGIIGSYKSQQVYTIHKLRLLNDNSFVFYIYEEIHQDTLLGNWKRRGHQIFLNSKEYKPFYVIKNCNNCSSNNLSVFDIRTGKNILVYYRTYYKNIFKSEGFTNIRGKVTFSDNIDSLCLESLEYNPICFKLKNNKSNIEVYMLRKEKYQFLKSKWYFKKNKIKCSNGLVLKKVNK